MHNIYFRCSFFWHAHLNDSELLVVHSYCLSTRVQFGYPLICADCSIFSDISSLQSNFDFLFISKLLASLKKMSLCFIQWNFKSNYRCWSGVAKLNTVYLHSALLIKSHFCIRTSLSTSNWNNNAFNLLNVTTLPVYRDKAAMTCEWEDILS